MSVVHIKKPKVQALKKNIHENLAHESYALRSSKTFQILSLIRLTSLGASFFSE